MTNSRALLCSEREKLCLPAEGDSPTPQHKAHTHWGTAAGSPPSCLVAGGKATQAGSPQKPKPESGHGLQKTARSLERPVGCTAIQGPLRRAWGPQTTAGNQQWANLPTHPCLLALFFL